MNKLEESISNCFTKIKNVCVLNKYTLCFYFIFSVFYVLPILFANVYYRDDLRRSTNGSGWDYDGRNLSTFMMTKLTGGGGYITDYFPYSIIFAAFIVAFSGYMVVHIIGLEKNNKIKLSALILLLNPFFLENLSYRWDSIPMAISIFTVIVPFLFTYSNWRFLLFSVLGFSITMFTYQASAPIYLLMALLVLTNKCVCGDKDILRSIILFCGGFLLSAITYKLLTWNVDLGQRSSLIPLDNNFFNILTKKINLVFDLIQSAFNNYYIAIVGLSIILATLGYIKFLRSNKPILNKILPLFFGILIVILIPITILILNEIWIGARILVTFPFITYFIFIFANLFSKKIITCLSILYIIFSFAVVSSYGNSLKAQNSLDESLAENIAQTVDIRNKEIVFIGQVEYAPEVSGAVKKFPLFKYIVPPNLQNPWGWIYLAKANKFIYNQPILDFSHLKKSIKNKDLVPIVDETYYYVLRADSSKVIIDYDASVSKHTKIDIP